MFVSVRSRPARGPESNAMDSDKLPAGRDDGTRTEAEQKVPQAKPEWAVKRKRPWAVARAIVAPVPESPAGLASTPR